MWNEIKTTKNPVQFNRERFTNSSSKFDLDDLIEHYCFKETNIDFTSNYGLWKSSNFHKAAKQAFEMKDFKILYKIINKGLEIEDKNSQLAKLLYNYLYAAIEQDPMIEEEERESMLIEVSRECTLKYSKLTPLEKEQEAIKNVADAHKLIKRLQDDDESDHED